MLELEIMLENTGENQLDRLLPISNVAWDALNELKVSGWNRKVTWLYIQADFKMINFIFPSAGPKGKIKLAVLKSACIFSHMAFSGSLFSYYTEMPLRNVSKIANSYRFGIAFACINECSFRVWKNLKSFLCNRVKSWEYKYLEWL